MPALSDTNTPKHRAGADLEPADRRSGPAPRREEPAGRHVCGAAGGSLPETPFSLPAFSVAATAEARGAAWLQRERGEPVKLQPLSPDTTSVTEARRGEAGSPPPGRAAAYPPWRETPGNRRQPPAASAGGSSPAALRLRSRPLCSPARAAPAAGVPCRSVPFPPVRPRAAGAHPPPPPRTRMELETIKTAPRGGPAAQATPPRGAGGERRRGRRRHAHDTLRDGRTDRPTDRRLRGGGGSPRGGPGLRAPPSPARRGKDRGCAGRLPAAPPPPPRPPLRCRLRSAPAAPLPSQRRSPPDVKSLPLPA